MSHDADVLNRLIVRLRAAAAAYRGAGADGPGLADVFEASAAAHDRTVETLAAEVRALGGAPAGEGGGLDLARRSSTDLPRAVPEGEAATAAAMERIEAELLADFQAAREDPATSGPVRDAILRAFDGVKAGHDQALQRLDALGG